MWGVWGYYALHCLVIFGLCIPTRVGGKECGFGMCLICGAKG